MMLRAQASFEFLLVFALTVCLVFLIVSALSAYKNEVIKQGSELGAIYSLQPLALRTSVLINDGGHFWIGDDTVSYRIEEGRLHISRKDAVVEITGVFENDDAEPI